MQMLFDSRKVVLKVLINGEGVGEGNRIDVVRGGGGECLCRRCPKVDTVLGVRGCVDGGVD